MNAPDLIDPRATALLFVRSCPRLFRADFYDWLRDNFHVWKAFEREANKVWASGRTHYSARTLGEFLRHQTTISEAPNALQVKLNNNVFPDLARLYECHYPERTGFFEKRSGMSARRAA